MIKPPQGCSLRGSFLHYAVGSIDLGGEQLLAALGAEVLLFQIKGFLIVAFSLIDGILLFAKQVANLAVAEAIGQTVSREFEFQFSQEWG